MFVNSLLLAGCEQQHDKDRRNKLSGEIDNVHMDVLYIH